MEAVEAREEAQGIFDLPDRGGPATGGRMLWAELCLVVDAPEVWCSAGAWGGLLGPAGAVVGEFNGVLFKVIDQDCDGRFDGIGKDALVVGRGESAAYLSEVVTVGDEMFRLEVAEDGSELRFSPFEGESGVLDVHDGYQTDGKPQRFVVRDLSGHYSFDLGKASDGLRVPAGA